MKMAPDELELELELLPDELLDEEELPAFPEVAKPTQMPALGTQTFTALSQAVFAGQPEAQDMRQ